MPKITLANGLNVHYQQDGAGPDLVLIHGLTSNLSTWHFKIVPMLWQDFRVLTYDLRGHGYTDMTEMGYTPTDHAEDLKQLLDALGIEKAYLAGHSFGADIALYCAYLYPERVAKAVLIDPLVPAVLHDATKGKVARRNWMRTMVEGQGIEIPPEKRLDDSFIVEQFFEVNKNRWGPGKGMTMSPERRDWLLKLSSTTTIYEDAVKAGALTVEQIPSIEVPVHLVYDSAAPYWLKSYRVLKKSLPHVTSTTMRSAPGEIPHLAPLERPEMVGRLIREALIEPPPKGRRGSKQASR